MNKIFYRSLLLLILCSLATALNTDAIFMSPQTLGRLPEIKNALQLMPSISVANISYNFATKTYTLFNFITKNYYNNGKQKGEIPVQQQIKTSGGTIEVFCQFNYSINGPTKINGYGYGSIITDSIVYTKELVQVAKPYEWKLKQLQPIKSSQGFILKRLEPYTAQDFTAIQKMVHGAESITPQNLGNQILKQINLLLPNPLNNVLNHESFDIDTQYKYYHPNKGQMILNLTRQNYAFSVTPSQGAAYIFKTSIKEYSTQICQNQQTISKHLDWNVYGGHQTIHLSCLYQGVLNYMQQKGWLNTQLNSEWDVKQFQFFAGDMYNIVGNLQENGIPPRAPIKGNCNALKNITFGLQTSQQSAYKMTNVYSCYLESISQKTGSLVKFMKFNATIDYVIEVLARQTDLQFHIINADVLKVSSQNIPQFPLIDGLFGLFKADKVIRKMIGFDVFGTGYIMRDNYIPRTKVNRQGYAIFYDQSLVRNIQNTKIVDI